MYIQLYVYRLIITKLCILCIMSNVRCLSCLLQRMVHSYKLVVLGEGGVGKSGECVRVRVCTCVYVYNRRCVVQF